MAYILELVKDKGFDTIWLSVWEGNPQALSFYKKQGFETFTSSIFVVGKVKRKTLLMKKHI
jgi:ribosomal protein S18 acetylase RimI-like enzyme